MDDIYQLLEDVEIDSKEEDIDTITDFQLYIWSIFHPSREEEECQTIS